MLYTLLPGSNCSKNQSLCWANDAGKTNDLLVIILLPTFLVSTSYRIRCEGRRLISLESLDWNYGLRAFLRRSYNKLGECRHRRVLEKATQREPDLESIADP